jgi:TetR/AcrR family tetracycline transcriptional repressor
MLGGNVGTRHEGVRMVENVVAARPRLSRDRVLEAALEYVDTHGLDALSMHKLGDALGVKGMSLYGHVANKDDLLNGIGDLLWAKVARPPADRGSWQEIAVALARSLRNTIRRHPHAAQLMVSGQVLSEHALLLADAYRDALVDAGLPDERAKFFLRTVVTYTMGYSLAELSWTPTSPDDDDDISRIRRVTNLLPAGASEELLRTAIWFCAECDTNEQFDDGVILMTQGLAAMLAERPD